MLEKGAAVNIAYFKPDHAYSMTILSGPVIVDTEGGTQNWKLTSGTIHVNLTGVNGKISVRPFSDRISTVILDGQARLKSGSETRSIMAGREVVLAADGTVDEKRASSVRGALSRLRRLRPRTSTAFETPEGQSANAISGLLQANHELKFPVDSARWPGANILPRRSPNIIVSATTEWPWLRCDPSCECVHDTIPRYCAGGECGSRPRLR